jgi:hypothetical protein
MNAWPTKADKGDEEGGGLEEQAVRLELCLHPAVHDADDAVHIRCRG